MIRYGLPCVLASVPQMLNLRLDQMLMAAFFPPRDLGFYVVALAWSSAVSPLVTSIGMTLMPAVASTLIRERAVERLSQGVRFTAVLAVLSVALVACGAPFLIPALFGAEFRHSVIPSLILVPAAGILGFNFSMQEGLRGLGYPYCVLRAELIGLGVTAIMLAIVLRPCGIIGAAIASLAGYSAVTAVLMQKLNDTTGRPITSFLPGLVDGHVALSQSASGVRNVIHRDVPKTAV
jgi:O-antigen/teichoic acid export membrane protein